MTSTPSQGMGWGRIYTLYTPYLFHNLSCLFDDVSASVAHDSCHFHGIPSCPSEKTISTFNTPVSISLLFRLAWILFTLFMCSSKGQCEISKCLLKLYIFLVISKNSPPNVLMTSCRPLDGRLSAVCRP